MTRNVRNFKPAADRLVFEERHGMITEWRLLSLIYTVLEGVYRKMVLTMSRDEENNPSFEILKDKKVLSTDRIWTFFNLVNAVRYV